MAAPDPRRWLALAVLLTGTLLPPLDFFIVNVALPAIRADLQASSDVSQLVISVHAAAYAVTLILGGRLGDLFGRKRIFIAGMFGFGVASVLCGLALSPSWQGLAPRMSPARESLSMVASAHDVECMTGEERRAARRVAASGPSRAVATEVRNGHR
jgi:MFS family permease